MKKWKTELPNCQRLTNVSSIDVGEETDQSERFISMPEVIEDALQRCCPLKAHKRRLGILALFGPLYQSVILVWLFLFSSIT